MLGFATGSFGDSGDPYREQMFTRLECAEFLLDAGAAANPAIWEDAIRARAKGVLQLLSRKGVLPRKLDGFRNIYLAGIQAGQQVIRRQVYKDNFRCFLEDGIGHGFAN